MSKLEIKISDLIKQQKKIVCDKICSDRGYHHLCYFPQYSSCKRYRQGSYGCVSSS